MNSSRRVSFAAVACVLACALACGCAGDDRLVEYRVLAEHEGVRAELTVPLNEARSAGTYDLRIELKDGSADVLKGERDGMVAGLWAEDLDGSGVSEVVVGMASAGSGSYGSLHVYGRVGGEYVLLQMSPLTAEQSRGYMGHDEYIVQNGAIHRRFPVYLEGDTNAEPGGGLASLRYSFESDVWVSDEPLEASEEE